jgi:hypothetical protein
MGRTFFHSLPHSKICPPDTLITGDNQTSCVQQNVPIITSLALKREREERERERERETKGLKYHQSSLQTECTLHLTQLSTALPLSLPILWLIRGQGLKLRKVRRALDTVSEELLSFLCEIQNINKWINGFGLLKYIEKIVNCVLKMLSSLFTVLGSQLE